MSDFLKAQYQSSHLSGLNATYVEEMYESWLDDPDTVPGHWCEVFDRILDDEQTDTRHQDIAARFAALALNGHYQKASGSDSDRKQAGVLRMINAFRMRGHQKADLDPLGLVKRQGPGDLSLSFHDLGEDDLRTSFHTGSLPVDDHLPLADILELCERTYCGTIGYEYMHITDTEQRRWLMDRIESAAGDYSIPQEEQRTLFSKLLHAEGMEKYLHSKYVGQKRFSLEGAESLIPMMDTLINHSGRSGIKEMVIGMAHRGRLNLLINILGKSPKYLFAEFEGTIERDNPNRAGDVKYHLGYSSDVKTPGGAMHLALAFNPSHLEIVDPVVVGSARARQDRRQDRAHEEVIPVLIHGDAAVAGQGVVMELFNMSQARGFAVGGSFHIVVNNQIGFTTSNPVDARSTMYCTEVAKMVQAPIFHVNADDPEAVLFVTRMAADFRRKFKKDVMIDLVCYRRHGHNEADEPAATQPEMYEVIRSLESVRQQYGQKLLKAGVITQDEISHQTEEYRDRLDAGEPVVELMKSGDGVPTVDWEPYLETDWREKADTSAPLELIQKLSEELTTLPEGFKLHRQVERIIESRRQMAEGKTPMDWGFAETMAYATLLDHGHGLRLVGQDSGRGTFFHRHAILYHQETGKPLIPLKKLAREQQTLNIIDSLLSEEAVMGFEYGYATAEPESLVIWEAQFGDFVNGAQVVIDQFLTSGETKWGRLSGLVLFLPHGYEGQGPEHSSARLERFMQQCSGNNIQVCVPTLPAQMFHMLRRQMLRPLRKPLIVMTPKSLLRHKKSVSSLQDLTEGEFQLLIDDPSIKENKAVKRLVFCSGKVYFDLAAQQEEEGIDDVALVRIEQLYPFPREELSATLERYQNAREVVWCQEEPMNQGAWFQIRHHLQACIHENQKLLYAGRPGSASPAVGYYQIHLEEQKALVTQALTKGEGLE